MTFRVRRGRAAAWVGVAVVAAIVSVSCNSSRKASSRRGAAQPVGEVEGPPGSHWVQGARLRAVMGEVSEHAKRWPAGVPEEPESPQLVQSTEAREAFRDAAALAEGLADAAERIPEAVRRRQMRPGDRRGFNTEARRLQRQAVELKAAAEGGRVERMQRALDAISSTCAACHGRYRNVAGELRAGTAPAD